MGMLGGNRMTYNAGFDSPICFSTALWQIRGISKQAHLLGVAIAATIPQFHQGTLSVTSQLGQGSIFTIHLPVSS
jgi:light-regulated signal transduction histidine kinase (bacteriophytochrome)